MAATVPLSVLDLAPVVAGGTAGDALRRTLDLARHAEQFGYRRYWVAEHHLTPGVASSQPARRRASGGRSASSTRTTWRSCGRTCAPASTRCGRRRAGSTRR